MGNRCKPICKKISFISHLDLKTPTERLIYLLQNSGYNATELSKRLPISVSTASRWLNGKAKHLDEKKRALYANYMGFDLHWIEHGEPDPAPLEKMPDEEEFTIEQLLREERLRYGIEDIPDTEMGRSLQDALDDAVSVVLRLRRLIEIERRESEKKK